MSLKTFISDLLNCGLLSYDEEAGRCGRDGQPEVVKLYIANKVYCKLEICSSKFNRKELRTHQILYKIILIY